ncbi:MAG: class I SAM-dependent methyltransferase [Pirellulaceae bacterium]
MAKTIRCRGTSGGGFLTHDGHVGQRLARKAILGFYSEVILPSFYDVVMDTPFLARHGQKHLVGVSGEVLEIGAGTGLKLPHYLKGVRKISTVNSNRGMNRRLQARGKATGMEVDMRAASSEQLPFEDVTFASIVSTLTLCSISRPGRCKQTRSRLGRGLAAL